MQKGTHRNQPPRRRLGLLAALAVAAAGMAVPARAEMNTTELLAKYEASTESQRQLVELVVSSTENGFSWANTFLKTSRQAEQLYCNDLGRALTGAELIAILKEEQDKSTALAVLPFGMAMLLALQSRFPC